MGKRFFCLICAAVLVIAGLFGMRVEAAQWQTAPVGGAANQTTKTRPAYRANALVSAMFLVLAGVGISMLFDKKG